MKLLAWWLCGTFEETTFMHKEQNQNNYGDLKNSFDTLESLRLDNWK